MGTPFRRIARLNEGISPSNTSVKPRELTTEELKLLASGKLNLSEPAKPTLSEAEIKEKAYWKGIVDKQLAEANSQYHDKQNQPYDPIDISDEWYMTLVLNKQLATLYELQTIYSYDDMLIMVQHAIEWQKYSKQ